MKTMVVYDAKLYQVKNRGTDIFTILMSFKDTGCRYAEIINFNYKNAYSGLSSWHNAIVNYGLHEIGVMTRKGRLFLVNDLVSITCPKKD